MTDRSTQKTECQVFSPVFRIGSAHSLNRRRVLPPGSLGSGGGHTHCGGPNSDYGTHTVVLYVQYNPSTHWSHTLPWWLGGEEGKDDRKQNTTAPLPLYSQSPWHLNHTSVEIYEYCCSKKVFGFFLKLSCQVVCAF